MNEVDKPREPLLGRVELGAAPQIEVDHPAEFDRRFVPSDRWDLVVSFVMVAFAYRSRAYQTQSG